jgi:ABC-type phosphonate transport system ATPase subunit
MTPLLSVHNLGKSYGARVGCEHVSFDLHAGEVLAVVGESGSGKTTLLRLSLWSSVAVARPRELCDARWFDC